MSHSVVIVEDDESLCVFYSRVLEGEGCDVFIAQNTDEAVAILEEHTPDAMFLDMMLPGMNGDGLLDYIKAQPHLDDMPILMISSNKNFAQHADRDNVEFRVKPILPADIREFIQRVLA